MKILLVKISRKVAAILRRRSSVGMRWLRSVRGRGRSCISGRQVSICDSRLDGEERVEFCRHLRAQPGSDEIFVLLITARSDTGDLQMALEAEPMIT
jgi:CheY-like chemotaxis protein